MSGRSELTEGLLLRSVDFGDADRIVTLLTASQGQAAFLARGARRSKKRFGSALEPFQLLSVQVSRGRGQLGTLHSAEVVRAFPGVLSSLPRLTAAGAGFEVLRHAVAEGQPDPALFATSIVFLQVLDGASVDSRAVLATYAMRVMALSGFSASLSGCGVCGKRPAAGQAALFDPLSGRIVCRGCGGAPELLSGRLLELLRVALGPDWYQAAEMLQPDDVEPLQRAAHAFVEARIERSLSAWTAS